MTPKEQLREKFIEILPVSLCETVEFTDTLLALLAAVEEVMSQPLHITIKPSDEQIEKLAKDFQSAAFQIWAYGDLSVPHVPSYGDNA